MENIRKFTCTTHDVLNQPANFQAEMHLAYILYLNNEISLIVDFFSLSNIEAKNIIRYVEKPENFAYQKKKTGYNWERHVNSTHTPRFGEKKTG